MKIIEKHRRSSPGMPVHIRYDMGDGREMAEQPQLCMFAMGWHFFVGNFSHNPVIIRETKAGGRWYLRAIDGMGRLSERVAGPFPSRRAAWAAWKLYQL